MAATKRDAAIQAFWKWWAKARPKFEAAISTGEFGALPDEAAKHAEAIDEGLQWEMGSGLRAEHFFALSPNGDARLRKLTERWKAAAPPEDETWEYWPARPPRPDATLDYEGHAMRLEECSFKWRHDASHEVLDVELHHPAFAKMSSDARESATVLLLDGALGEDDVERWIGAIEAAKKPPAGGKSFAAFMKALEKMVESATGSVLVTLEGTDEKDRPIEIVYNAALKRVDHLHLDQHATIALKLQNPTSGGLASAAEARTLQAMEDELVESLGTSAALLGHETNRGRRVIHLFVAESSDAPNVIARWAEAHAKYAPRVDVERDEAWEAAHQWNPSDD